MMMVPGTLRAKIVIELSVGVDDSRDNASIGQILQVSVDRRQADGRETDLERSPDFFRAEEPWLLSQNL